MKNNKALFGILLFFTIAGMGLGIFYLAKKKNVVMKSASPETEPTKKIIEQTPDKIVTEVTTSSGEKVVNTETIVDGKRQVVSELEGGKVIVIEDIDKLKADLEASFKNWDMSALEGLNLDLSEPFVFEPFVFSWTH